LDNLPIFLVASLLTLLLKAAESHAFFGVESKKNALLLVVVI